MGECPFPHCQMPSPSHPTSPTRSRSRAPSSPVASVSIGSVRGGSEDRERKEKSSKYPKKKEEEGRRSEEEEHKGRFPTRRITCAGLRDHGLHHWGLTGSAPCRGPLPCRGALPCRGIAPWRRSRSRQHLRGGFCLLLMGLFCSYTNKSTIKMPAKEKAPMRAPQQEVNQTLTLGAVLGAAARRRDGVRQGGLGRVFCHHSRIVLDDNHGDLGPLRRSLGQSPEEEQGSEGSRSDTRQETARIGEI